MDMDQTDMDYLHTLRYTLMFPQQAKKEGFWTLTEHSEM